MNRAVFAAAALSLSATPLALAASPAPASDTFKFQVAYSADMLNSVTGVEDVYSEISEQIRDACRENQISTRTLDEIRQTSVCTRQSIAQAVEQIDHEKLTAYHERMTKG